MNICIIYVLTGGFTLGTPACHTQLIHGDGAITPHEVVYTSHIPDCHEGHAYHVPTARINFHGHGIRVRRHHDIRRRYRQRVRHRSYRSHPRHHYRRYNRRDRLVRRHTRAHGRRLTHKHHH